MTLPNWRALLGPRPFVMGGFTAVVIALVVAFGWAVLAAQSESRSQAQSRFNAQASLSAELTSTLFGTSVSSSAGAAAKQFGAATVSSGSVAAAASAAHLTGLTILDHTGRALASSPGAAAIPTGERRPAFVQQALAGHAWFSDVGPPAHGSKAATISWAIPFATPFGRRVEVETLPGTPIFQFLSSYLAKTRTAGTGAAFVLDSTQHVVADAGVTGLRPGSSPKAAALVDAISQRSHGTYDYSGARRYFASSPVGGSNWHVAISITTSALYPAFAGTRSWLLYLAIAVFALLAALSLGFFRRAVSTGVELEETNGELTALNASLEKRVAERTAAAEDRARELARSNEELEQFSSVASHDLQEPLRKIRMFGDRLHDRIGDALADDAAEDLERMQSAAQRMQRLIGDLLDFSRVTHRGKAFERVDLATIVKEVVSDLEAPIVELGADVEVGALPSIDADPTQMRQLLQNLIGNALKFHRPDEAPAIRITGETIEGRAPRFAGEAATSPRVVITVADNGIGFDERHADRIFTAFERLHGRAAYDGTGIGLSIARKIVWRHNGDISARGVPGAGATFTVTLPLRQPEPNEQPGGAR
jgi:signal transduction histidine kinase